MAMALASQADVEARLGRPLTAVEETRISALLDDASAVVIGYAGRDFEPAPYPDAAVGVVAKMAARSLDRAGGTGLIEQENAGPFGVRYSAASSVGDVWLTAADKLALRSLRLTGGLTSIALVGPRYEITDDEA